MHRVILVLVIGCAATAVVVAADPPKAKPSSSLDDELFKDLDEATTAPGVKPKPATTAKPAAPALRPSNPLDDELLKQLERDDAASKVKPSSKPAAAGEGEQGPKRSASDDPFLRLTEQIRDAEARLRRTETGEPTQQLQQQIVDDLEKLIAQIEQQQQQRRQSQQQQQQKGSQSQPQPGRPQPQPGQQQGNQESSQARDSQQGTRSTADRKADPGNLKSLLEKAWGSLPERERQAVMQTSVDDFPAKYQAVIEEYFKTLLKREE